MEGYDKRLFSRLFAFSANSAAGSITARGWGMLETSGNVIDFSHCALRLKALAETERLRIVHSLFGGPKNVSELATALSSEIANVSHHLGVLRHANIVRSEKQGRFVVYRLATDVFASVEGELRALDLGYCRLEFTSTTE